MKSKKKVKVTVEIYDGRTKIKSETRKYYADGRKSRRGRITSDDLVWLPPFNFPQLK